MIYVDSFRQAEFYDLLHNYNSSTEEIVELVQSCINRRTAYCEMLQELLDNDYDRCGRIIIDYQRCNDEIKKLELIKTIADKDKQTEELDNVLMPCPWKGEAREIFNTARKDIYITVSGGDSPSAISYAIKKFQALFSERNLFGMNALDYTVLWYVLKAEKTGITQTIIFAGSSHCKNVAKELELVYNFSWKEVFKDEEDAAKKLVHAEVCIMEKDPEMIKEGMLGFCDVALGEARIDETFRLTMPLATQLLCTLL
jgi:hypothetical protein